MNNYSLRSCLLLAGSLLTLVAAAPLRAQLPVSWSSPTAFDTTGNNYFSAVAIANRNIVEVNETDTGLSYHTGHLNSQFHHNGTLTWYITWSGAAILQSGGFAPAVAIVGSTVVEENSDGSGHLSLRTGQLSSDGSTVTWNSPTSFGTGDLPSLSAIGNTVIEVHNAPLGSASNSTELYRTAVVQSNGTLGPWTGAVSYDTGYKPSITTTGNTIVEVHAAQNAIFVSGGYVALWYRTGQLQSNGAIVWGGSVLYGYGSDPCVAAYSSNVVQLESTPIPFLDSSFVDFYWRSGLLQSNNSVAWGSTGSGTYAKVAGAFGSWPSVAVWNNIFVFINSYGPGPLYSTVGVM